MLTQNDLIQLEAKGIKQEILAEQLDYFGHGFPSISLLRPATADDGIMVFGEEEKNRLIRLFEEESAQLAMMKFVPASGAASRMFKHLFEFRELMEKTGGIPEIYHKDTGFNSARHFFDHIFQFAFFDELKASVEKNGTGFSKMLENHDFTTILDHLLRNKGLSYATLPKALLSFHNYNDGSRTALEEHLVEAASYARDKNHVSKVHFTVSSEHILKFDEKIASVIRKYEDRYKTHFDIRHSIQKSSTDTVAVNENNEPFRNPDGSLHFRPAGHGALLSNLNELDAEIIFIKNIDNTVPDRLKPPTIDHKKLIGGYLLQIRRKIIDFLGKAKKDQLSGNEIREMISFICTRNLVSLPAEIESQPEGKQCELLFHALNRPIRVCGMVKNAGEPGGGPFWVGREQEATLQIVESSQVDMHDKMQKKVFGESTHFNPVDLVCSIRDYKGDKFNLQEFVDHSTGFIALKSSGGRTLKAQELPGLWNGSMAGWITVFVEVPLITFNPVKTINDLLRDEHQS